MQSSFNHSRAMSTHGDPFINRPMSAGPHFRSESRNFNPVGRGYPTGQRAQEFMQRRPSNTYQLDRQTYGQDEEDYEYCRPRGSTIGDCEPDIFGGHRRRGSFGLGGHLGNQGAHNMYGSMYGMGMMGASPREQMMRAQMMRGDLYSMDPMMSRMGMGSGYGDMYGGMGGYGMCGPGSIYGGGMMGRSMMGMGPMGGMGMGMGMYGGGMYGGMYGRPYRMSGLVETPSPHLTRAKTWSAYGRLY